MFTTPKIIVGDSGDQFPDVDAEALLYIVTDGRIYLRIIDRWIRIYTRKSSALSLTRSQSEVPVTAPNADNLVRFTHPFPPGVEYTVFASVLSSAGYTVGSTVGTRYSYGFMVNPIEAGLCTYQAMVKT